jgi:hypothetical protein
MKTYTPEELKTAQNKGCQIEYYENGVWQEVLKHLPFSSLVAHAQNLRIHPADEWKARLPRLKDGAEWCCKGSDFHSGNRPYVIGEYLECLNDCQALSGFGYSTRRPVPPEFLHESELAKQSESAPQPPCDCIEKCGKFWIQRCSCHNSGDLANAEAWCQEQNRYPEAAQATDFGEPWETVASGSINTSGDFDGMIEILSNKRVVARFYAPDDKNEADFSRIIACINALRGVPDPAEFVRQARENAEILKRLGHH